MIPKSLKQPIFLAVLLTLVMAMGCQKDRAGFYVEEGALNFSVDTIYFDSIFTSFDSPTERVVVTNRTGANVRISEIKLESGAEFDMIFDGITADEVQDYELDNGDSAVAFISFVSDRRDEFARDKLLFTVGDNTQDVDIEAFVFDAIFYQDTVLGFGGPNISVFDPTKKHVIDGCLQVADGHTLIIPAGTQVFFTPRKDESFNLVSSIKVFGRLLVQGALGNEVVFQGTRFGDRYEETAAQWRGLAFANISVANSIEHAIIKNGLIGVYQELGNSGIGPKILLNKTEIRNMGAYGILSVGYEPLLSNHPMIRATNCLVHNCSEGTLGILGGGKYEFQHCTFANYTMDFSRNSAQILLNNYNPEPVQEYPLEADFDNCIIWGSEEEEVVPDTFPAPNIYNAFFNNCIVRTTLDLKGSNIMTDTDFDYPKFENPTAGEHEERDYRLKGWSPAVNAGPQLPGVNIDKDERMRDATPDLGCYEYAE